MDASHELTLEERPAGAARRQSVGNGRGPPVDDEATEAFGHCEGELPDPVRWGLSADAIATLGEPRDEFWPRCRGCFKTCTRDTRANASDYLRGQLPMATSRNFAPRARTMPGDDGQARQHFRANSPWSGPAVCRQIQAEIKALTALAQGSPLMLEESADAKAGPPHVGAWRQDHGRLGTVDVCRVDPCLTSANGGRWAMVDGELVLPEAWFGAAWAERRQALGVPEDRRGETTLELGVKMVQRVKAHGLPFDRLAGEAFYGRDSQLRAALEGEHGP